MNTFKTIIILGAGGFVGKNISEELPTNFQLYLSSRDQCDLQKTNYFYFDLEREDTWPAMLKLNPDFIINCIGYGVMVHEKESQQIFNINYVYTIKFYKFLADSGFKNFLIHIGSSFEYDLDISGLSETSRLMPKSLYGISKMMASKYLLEVKPLKHFSILRPFNLFGPYEHESRLFPALIKSQKNTTYLPLTSGEQRRDFVYIKDFVLFVIQLINTPNPNGIPNLINVGNGSTFSLIEMAAMISRYCPSFNEANWRWNSLPQRKTESSIFFNQSSLARHWGYKETEMEKAIEETVKHYYSLKNGEYAQITG